ncbi:MAG: ATP-binding cassette domain-containing protein [Acutalibacteraceae bacterium]
MKAIDGINFRVNANEILGIVGESGCGKATCQSIMRLYDEKYTVILPRRIHFKGKTCSNIPGERCRASAVMRYPWYFRTRSVR